ncbi:uncharacterized protein si:dkey-204f11.3 [Salvelinus fontinalis]|uniref:uncharacterized protein si:dkey-204f11.3 n=1 Tax=Salvelinus fontinalis TaxID=8038 RepID=UPI0024860229|nr:uncharacterized protein si:dkey-204f11.3 [Salvelinus fontinalis]
MSFGQSWRKDFILICLKCSFGEADIEMDHYGDIEEEGEEEEEEEKGDHGRSGRPRRPRQPQQQQALGHIGVQIKDYFCCSVFNTMFCNCLFLGLLALLCSYQVRKRMAKRDLKGAVQWSCLQDQHGCCGGDPLWPGLFHLCLYFGHFLCDTNMPYEGLSSYSNSYDAESYRP